VPVRYFLVRRAARIFPIYYLLLLVIALVRPHPEIKWCAVYLSNYYGALRAPETSSWLHHTWSLCVEEHFYSCWPLLVAFLPLRVSRRIIGAVVIPGAILCGIVLLLLPAIGPVWSWIEGLIGRGRIDRFDRYDLILFGTQCRVLSLALGSLFAFHETTIRTRLGKSLIAAGLGLVAAVLVIRATPALGAALEMLVGPAQPAGRWNVLPRVVATSFTTSSLLLLLIATEARPRSPTRLLQFAPLRAVGRISYGLYLYHLPLFQFLGLSHLGREGESGRIWAALAALFAVATLSYFVIERPILRWAARFRVAPPTAPLAVPLALQAEGTLASSARTAKK
jgi:peptidoglycan/LPS O-acetylase OafA/YrhL